MGLLLPCTLSVTCQAPGDALRAGGNLFFSQPRAELRAAGPGKLPGTGCRGLAVLPPQAGPRPRKVPEEDGSFQTSATRTTSGERLLDFREEGTSRCGRFLALGLGPPLAFSSGMSSVPWPPARPPLAALASRRLQPPGRLP